AGQPRSRQRPAPAERPVPPRCGGRSCAGYGAGIARDISLAESDGHVGAEQAPPVFLFSLCPHPPAPSPTQAEGRGAGCWQSFFLPSLWGGGRNADGRSEGWGAGVRRPVSIFFE